MLDSCSDMFLDSCSDMFLDSCSDMFLDSCSDMFPGSQIGKEHSYAQTKATELIKFCVNNIVMSTAARFQTGPFTDGMDGSQEAGEKCYLMVVWYVTTNGEINTELITNLTWAEPSTGENFFQLMNKMFDSITVE